MPGPSDAEIRQAGELVALWQDLMDTTTHDARFGQVLQRFAIKLAEAADEKALHCYGEFQPPFREEPIGIAMIASPTHACLLEGNPHDWQSGLTKGVLKRHFQAGNAGALDAEDLWSRQEFLDGAKTALTRLDEGGIGALWAALQHSTGVAGKLALWSLLHGESNFLEWFGHLDRKNPPVVQEWPWEKPGPLKPNPTWATAALRVREIARRLHPHGLPLVIPTAVLRQRNPPTGPRKGRSLTMAEQLCWYLVGRRRLTLEQVRDALGMEDVRQVRSLLRSIKRKHAKWPAPPSMPLTSRMV